MNEHVDGYVVLAPSTPQTHLPLCQQVLPMEKTTYVDKTFTPNIVIAKKIFKLTDQHGAAVQTSSALRYTNVQKYVNSVGEFEKIKHMIAWGGGSSFEEYAIHPIELIIS